MSHSSVVINQGKLYDTIKENVGKESNYFKVSTTSSLVIERRTIGKNNIHKIISLTGKTIVELYEEAGIPVFLSESDREFISNLETLDNTTLDMLISYIESIASPWWLEIFNSDLNPTFRFRKYMYHREDEDYGEKLDLSKCPVLSSMIPVRISRAIQTDEIPQLAKELDIPISYFFNVKFGSVPFYSRNQKVDIAYLEYKMLVPMLRIIIQSIVECNIERNEG